MEGSALQQLQTTAELPGMGLAVGLPDLHPGKGSPIGAAFAVEGWLYPALVGNDIGCGIGLWRTGLSSKKVKREAWAERLRNLDGAWDGDAGEWLGARGVGLSGYEHSLGRSAAAITSPNCKPSRAFRAPKLVSGSASCPIRCTCVFTAGQEASVKRFSANMWKLSVSAAWPPEATMH